MQGPWGVIPGGFAPLNNGGEYTMNETPSTVEKVLPSTNKMEDLIRTADGSTFSLCAALYNIILQEDEENQALAFENAINLYDDIDSDETVPLEPSPYEAQKKALKDTYGDFVDSFIEFFTKRKGPKEAFYHDLWEAICNESFFSSEASKIFAFYYVVIDSRVPYFELEQGYEMSDESYRKLRLKHAATLKRVRYILNADFNQKTELASLLLSELGTEMPKEDTTVDAVLEYEKKLAILVEVLNTKIKASLGSFIQQMR